MLLRNVTPCTVFRLTWSAVLHAGLGDADIAEERCRLAQRLLERLRLRFRSLALKHGQVERRRLQIAVGVAAGEHLGEILGLKRLGAAFGDVAVVVVGLEQL
eukprot:4924758-Pleurochrysis_carterae.AAC.1